MIFKDTSLQVLNRHPQLLEASLGIDIIRESADVSLSCLDIKSTGCWETPKWTHGASPSPLAFLSLRKMQCSSLMCAPLKTISCRRSASAWPTLRQSQKPFWGLEHCHRVSSDRKINVQASKSKHILPIVPPSWTRLSLPCNPVFDVVEQTLRHERILVQVYQVWSLQVRNKWEASLWQTHCNGCVTFQRIYCNWREPIESRK